MFLLVNEFLVDISSETGFILPIFKFEQFIADNNMQITQTGHFLRARKLYSLDTPSSIYTL